MNLAPLRLGDRCLGLVEPKNSIPGKSLRQSISPGRYISQRRKQNFLAVVVILLKRTSITGKV